MTDRTRIARGSLAGALTPRADTRPGLTGALSIERDITLKAGGHLHLVAWVRDVAGVPFVSIVVEQGEGGGRVR
jgi:hypothetical protein